MTRPLRVLKSAVQNAKLGREEELGALKRLDDAGPAGSSAMPRARGARN